jgi:hypothetical protein
LEHNFRHAWSEAIFEAADDLEGGRAANKTCQREICSIQFSDLELDQLNWSYELLIGGNPEGYAVLKSALSGASSLELYEAKWINLSTTADKRTYDLASIGKDSCEEFRKHWKSYSAIFGETSAIPQCSVVVVKNQLLIFLDYAAPVDAVFHNTDDSTLLITAIGARVERIPAQGQVILRSGWSDSDRRNRVYVVKDLRTLGFLSAEVSAGVLDLSRAVLETAGFGNSEWQEYLLPPSRLEKGIVIDVNNGVARFSNGSKWKCVGDNPPAPGDGCIFLVADGAKGEAVAVCPRQRGGKLAFVGAWPEPGSTNALASAEPATPLSASAVPTTAPALPKVTNSATMAQGNCPKAITFAVAENGTLVYRTPKVSAKWFEKAQNKFSNVCFAQVGNSSTPGNTNYLIVLSTSRAMFNGLRPVFSKNTSTSTTPVSGSGIVTDNTGSIWNYSYQGTDTTTTTTTTQTNVPYTDTTFGLYASAYDESGALIGTAQRAATFRQGGEAANTLGYNIGSRLLSIHIREHLLEDIVKQVSVLP